MAGYKRIVSYIYVYEQGEKRESTGFVKINSRDGVCRIQVHMQGFYTSGQEPYQVYIFIRSREKLLGQLLGELESKNGALEWNGTTETDSLMGGEFTLEESRGIYIEGKGRVFAAEWDDYPVAVERFEPLRRFARRANLEAVSEKAVREEEPGEPETLTEDKRPGGETELLAATLEPDTGSVLKARQEPDTEPLKLPDARWSQWEYLTGHFTVMRYMDGAVPVSGIRLSSRDMSRIPRDKWGLGNNSFLLHGFYQYGHILLLRRQEEAEVRYQIGVPGVYNEREQMMATMFGFQEFKVIKGPDMRKGNFGYWCRTLE